MNKTFLSRVFTSIFTVPSEAKYIRIKIGIDNKQIFQLEEGTVATPYEPYQEDKLTILSPVQLEKVGDVRDRIIEKDRVWGVEKNTIRKSLTASNVAHNGTVNDLTEYIIDTLENSDTTNTNNVICNKLVTKVSTTEECCYVTKNQFRVRVLTNKYPNTESIKNEIINNKWYAIYKSKQPQFIPLPHSQQVKLRTFANKTNISFLTEIEGTIKAQVPKSLGATVNTHTEQISNLNKELDRVKKLEESTVSTVETGSDFTTVEATSGGYFEDVKLEGKTLVNLWGNKSSDFRYSGQTSFNSSTQCIEYTSTTNRFSNCFTKNNTQYKPDTKYTIIVNVFENTFTSTTGILKVNSDPGSGSDLGVSRETINIQGGFVGVKVFTLTTLSDLSNSNIAIRTYVDNVNAEVGVKLKFQMIILEGDHTQNPPSYFEGLASVGQDVDEIVVLSRGKNLFDGVFEDGDINSANGNDEINATRKRSRYLKVFDSEISFSEIPMRLCWYDKDKKFIKFENTKKTYIKPNNAMYIRFSVSNDVNNIMIVQDSTPAPYEPYQSDKKRLLYYNEETQSWEKPILREWNSIEKHADGKYYYHQRSGEVVLDGSEDEPIGVRDNFNNTIGFTIIMGDEAGFSGKVLSDKFSYKSLDVSNDSDEFTRIITPGGNSCLYFKINKSKLSTQDVQGFKQWLTSNNVTAVYQLAQEKVYECTNIDLITYEGETNYIVESGAISPKFTLKVHNNISNVVSLLQKKVSLLESNMTKYMITQNRLMLASRYNADTVSFKVDVATLRNSFEYDNDLYELILNNILVGKDNYDREYIEDLIIFYWMDFVISDEMHSTLFEIIEEQHNPKIVEEAPIE